MSSISYAANITPMPVNPNTTERIITPMPKTLIAAVDDYRFSNRLPSRAEAIRRLIEIGLGKQLRDESNSSLSNEAS